MKRKDFLWTLGLGLTGCQLTPDMSWFSALCGAGGGITSVDASYIDGFSTTQRFGGAGATGPQANITAFTTWALVLPNTSEVNQVIFGKGSGVSSSSGWGLNASVGRYRFSVGNGSSAVTSPSFGIAGPEVGKIQVMHGVVRSGVLYFYKNGVPVIGTGAGSNNIASYGSSGLQVVIGSQASDSAFGGGVICCGVCSATGMTDNEVETHYQSLISNPYALPTGATHFFKAQDAGATWIDTIAGISLTRTGTITPTAATLEYFSRYNPEDYTSDSTPITPQIANTAGLLDVLFDGDSRTQGVGGGGTSYSFRNDIGNFIIASSDITNMDFVGNLTSTAIKPKHNGYSGSTAGDHLNGVGQPSTATIMASYNPDIAVIYLGTNSSSSDAAITQGKADYLDVIRAYKTANANIRVVVFEETENQDRTQDARLQEYNYWLWNTAWPTLEAEGITLVKIRMYRTIRMIDGDYSDAVHPNAQGYTKMATPIYNALRLAAGYS